MVHAWLRVISPYSLLQDVSQVTGCSCLPQLPQNTLLPSGAGRQPPPAPQTGLFVSTIAFIRCCLHRERKPRSKKRSLVKRRSTSVIVRGVQIEATMRLHVAAITERTDVGKDLEKLGPSCMAGGNAKWPSCLGKQPGTSSTLGPRVSTGPHNSTPKAPAREKGKYLSPPKPCERYMGN